MMNSQLEDRTVPVVWACGSYRLDLSEPLIMAILNVTTDSFSGDGLAAKRGEIRGRAERALSEGAAILDIGGESSRPGALPVSTQEELDRVVPIVESLADLGVPLSVDTTKPEVMREVLAAGASIINDIRALEEPGATDVMAGSTAGVCLMHMKGLPVFMQESPAYDDVRNEVSSYLLSRTTELEKRGVARERVVLDPGFGFGKALEHNLALLAGLRSLLSELRYPLLVGVSRKSMLGAITGRGVKERVTASAVAAMLAVQRGASIVRVHDVAETRDALRVWSALRNVEKS